MSSSIAALARSIRPTIKPRLFSFLASSLAAPGVLAPKTLTSSRILSPISVRFASTKVVNAEDKIRHTVGDENFLRVLQDEIVAHEQALPEAELPKDFPFEIIDNPGHRSIILEREFQGEKIEVFVYRYSDGDAAEGQNTDDNHQPYISLTVTIDKTGLALRFWCNVYAEDLKIEKMMMKRLEDSDAEKACEGPYFLGYNALDEGFQRVFSEYLGLRGIEVSLYKFLRGHFMTRDDRKYIVRLKKLKGFVEK